jgi:mycofactocin system transcriptional regulator
MTPSAERKTREWGANRGGTVSGRAGASAPGPERSGGKAPTEAPARERTKAAQPTGRRPSTSRAELEQVALDLFASRGFDETTVDDIAAAAGIGRRTFFRYYRSKNDAVWGDFDVQLDRLRRWFDGCPAEVPLMEAVHYAVLTFNRLDAGQVPWHRRRMRLILNTPALQAHSTPMYARWRAVIAEFAARRVGASPLDLVPQLIAYAALGAAVAAYEQWLRDDDAELEPLLDRAMAELTHGFGGHEPPAPPAAGAGNAAAGAGNAAARAGNAAAGA